MSSLVKKEKCGIITNDNAESIADVIDYLLSNREIAEEKGVKGK